MQLHGFCDASTVAFGACIYIRVTNLEGSHSIQLLCSKARVAHMKTVTLQRLELCAAVLLSQLFLNVRHALHHIEFTEFYLWTDSTIVLSWISQSPSTWKVFVTNRVAEIQNNIDMWYHVSTHDNPADVLSRGLLANKIIITMSYGGTALHGYS